MDEAAKLEERRRRFAVDAKATKAKSKTLVELRQTPACSNAVAKTSGSSSTSVYGQNTCLEKGYLRLTSMPTADAVRPPHVLRAALDLLVGKWKQGQCEYAYACDQLKAIRQDLTVQLLRDSLAVQVYEAHGRIALAASDFSEFRSCHGMLKDLYAEGVRGCEPEFCGYGVLYALMVGGGTLGTELAGMRQDLYNKPHVRFAMQVCQAIKCGNAIQFWQLSQQSSSTAEAFMTALAAKLRPQMYECVLRSFMPTVSLAFLSSMLGFESKEEVAEYVSQQRGVFDSTSGVLNIKASRSSRS